MEAVQVLMIVFYDRDDKHVSEFGTFVERPTLYEVQHIIDNLITDEVREKATYCKIEEKYYLVKK
ncbi:hypothetical protein SAMN04487895_10383 [Paenibacillus sophorae]|uniref:Uncharacterized protein n=1 Tax=Paenibacillus sophorae TaxID=1333845 RepID=A0A1H8JN39_9BACL|nr:hypothetical protein [Paenibacillus sophorae]QWU13419.1 hypothetical protein KP014_15575 [Paenibacillus sophorae]SEN81955.1 hypothetical protein SAMN04487895_10383 [Paenibacillus sophorae]